MSVLMIGTNCQSYDNAKIIKFLSLPNILRHNPPHNHKEFVSNRPPCIAGVLIYECSRLSRRAVDFLSIVEALTEKKISVYIHQNGLETLLPNGAPNPIAQLVLGILAQFNSMERSLIRSRMESGYNHYRSLGG